MLLLILQASASPNTTWVAVIAAGVGGTVGVAGQWITQRTVSGRELRTERRDSYIHFLAACDPVLRAAVRSHQLGTVDEGLAAQQQGRLQELAEEAAAANAALETSIIEMDFALASLELIARPALLRRARRLQGGIYACVRGEISPEELHQLRRRFSQDAYWDLNMGGPWSLRAWANIFRSANAALDEWLERRVEDRRRRRLGVSFEQDLDDS